MKGSASTSAEPLAQNLGHLAADASSRGAIEQFVRSRRTRNMRLDRLRLAAANDQQRHEQDALERRRGKPPNAPQQQISAEWDQLAAEHAPHRCGGCTNRPNRGQRISSLIAPVIQDGERST
jgi:hypothetical protein